jgi:rod shape-determining protein MreD
MRNWIFLVAIVILGLIQVTILNYVRIFNIKPDLLLISLLLSSLFFEMKWAFILGVFAGILKDIFSIDAFGTNTLLFALWTYLIVKLSKKISIDNNYIRLPLMFIITLFTSIITRLIVLTQGNAIPLGITLRIMFLEPLYTALIFPLVLKYTQPILSFKVIKR